MTKPWVILSANGAIESRHVSRERASESRDKYILSNRKLYPMATRVEFWPELGQSGRLEHTRRIFKQLYREMGCRMMEVVVC